MFQNISVNNMETTGLTGCVHIFSVNYRVFDVSDITSI